MICSEHLEDDGIHPGAVWRSGDLWCVRGYVIDSYGAPHIADIALSYDDIAQIISEHYRAAPTHEVMP